MSNKKTAVVLLSGGMDSSLCIAEAIEAGFTPATMHLNYGQKTETRELKSFHDISDYYGIEKRLVSDVSYLTQIGGSSLTDDAVDIEKADLDSKEIPSSYVPFRNGNILAIAAAWAEIIGAEALYIGAVEADSSGYPDCRRSFFDAFEEAVNLGTKPETNLKIITPIINLSKAEIVKRGTGLKLPFELTWSCYSDSEKACGVCDSCALRLRGFSEAGVVDPLEYKVRPKYD
ncbi:MAG: 7-cyano-7-deazaguanine synthase QueC [Candidatus Kapabacteria bacterium]|jgi:7-cyano-7-deazaguanine synthase|nr:7-cyano-7-deazaguanine synthase QueC [Candidatus Kapabacteria bacterium]